MILSPRGLTMIARFEGYRRYVYNDPFNATIGYGHLLHLGKMTALDRIRYAYGWPPAVALIHLRRDAARAVAAVQTVHRPLDQAQFDALCDFTYNCGSGALSELLRGSLPDDLLAWDHAGGVILPGLRTRREADVTLYKTGKYPT